MPDGLGKQRERLRHFILDSIKLDALMDARARDLEVLGTGGKVLYAPDHSTWSAFFFPVTDGQVHRGDVSIIPGFAEVFRDADRSDELFQNGPLKVNDVTGILGKVLIDAIFDQTDESDIAPDFFLTEESKAGLNEAIKAAVRTRSNNAKDSGVQRSVATALTALSKEFHDTGDLPKLFSESPEKLGIGGTLAVLLDDENPVNINERVETYNEIGFIDWSYIEDALMDGEAGEEVLNFKRADIREYERLVEEFQSVFSKHLPPSASEGKIASMSEILALNAIVERAGRTDIRFAYLTNAPWAIRDFDRFAWDAHSDTPLRPIRGRTMAPTVSYLFVRSPLCFLHDTELSPEEDETTSSLKTFMDSIVPRQLHDKHRLSISSTRERLLNYALNDLDDGKADLYGSEVKAFYERWGKKKAPWINAFLARKGAFWKDGLELFSKEGFHSYWRDVNHHFAQNSWQLGIYVAMMMDENAARAAPLTFIDCDRETNELLAQMQAALAGRHMVQFQAKILKFIDRRVKGQSEERQHYFDALVNAVLFMFSNQFKASLLHTETACDLALRSSETDVTGREAFYLRSHLMRITAQNRDEIEMARKLMLIARSKLEIDNENLSSEEQVSTIRFDVEDWSRRIVLALADYFDKKANSRQFPRNLFREYLTFVKNASESDFAGLKSDERNSLFERICERIKFNFLVLAVTLDSSVGQERNNSRHMLTEIVNEWNRTFGKRHEHLALTVFGVEYNQASIIERAYYLALAAGAPKAEFISDDFDIRREAESFFANENRRKSIALAETSFVDKERYYSLEKYCFDRLRGWDLAE
ncbi:hypothetical protein [Kordiimonas sp.]|uniref:hypothetical protein n=1 Tax=Kordiimonas sp. TaxID=1970157 RepID=UPI003A95C6F1